MQAQVMKNCQYIVLLQCVYQLCTFIKRRTDQVEHMRIVRGIAWDLRKLEIALISQRFKGLVITVPVLFPFVLYLIQMFDLCPQESSNHFGWQKRRAYVHPAVFIYFAPEKLGTIGTFLPDDLGTMNKPFVVDCQHTTFS